MASLEARVTVDVLLTGDIQSETGVFSWLN